MNERRVSLTTRAALTISGILHLLLLISLVWLQVADPPERELPPLVVVSVELERQERKPFFRRAPRQSVAKTAAGLVTNVNDRPPQARRMRQFKTPLNKLPANDFPLIPVSMERPELPYSTATTAQTGHLTGNGTADEGVARGSGKGQVASTVFLKADERPGLQTAIRPGKLAPGDPAPQPPRLELKSPLQMIAENLVNTHEIDIPLDVVFVLDISQSMQDNIYAVAKHLEEMANFLESHALDFHVGIVTFHHSTWNAIMSNTIDIMPLTHDVAKIRKELRKVKCSGGEKALNAIMEATHRVEFRNGATRRFIFVTDEFADGDYKSREVFGALYQGKVRVDVIGMDEPFQRALAARTGGLWIPIASLSS